MDPAAQHRRRIAAVVRQRLHEEPVVVLTGPRTVGKSTLLRALAQELGREIVDLDAPQTRAAAESDPAFFVAGPAPVLIDEFQLVPQTLDAIKAALNVGLSPGRFVLTGSTRYGSLPRAAQSLTGRAHVMVVWPLSQGELDGVHETFVAQLLDAPEGLVGRAGSTTTREDYIERVVRGGLPVAASRRGAARGRWFADYVRLICERDVLELSRVRQGDVLPRLLTRLAAQTGQLLSVAEAARAVGLEQSTAETYTRLLEAVFLVHRLPAWGTTLHAKAGATPKVHVVDSGLAAHLLRLTPEKLTRRTGAALTTFGHLLETFAVGEILKQASWQDEVVTAGHWRTRDGQEVDLVLERSDGGVVGIEIKAGSRFTGSDGRGLAALADRLGEAWLGGAVLNTGVHAFTCDADRRLVVLPVDHLWRA